MIDSSLNLNRLKRIALRMLPMDQMGQCVNEPLGQVTDLVLDDVRNYFAKQNIYVTRLFTRSGLKFLCSNVKKYQVEFRMHYFNPVE